MLRPEYGGSVSAERFKREIAILSRLDDPNIVPLYDAGDFEGLPWYSMPYVTGESLRQRLRREGMLPIPETLRIARAVAEALDHAHAAGVIHRDIKPGNILLEDGKVLVADFGIARAMTQSATDHTISSSGLQIGTPAYMSPEQASGGGLIDGRSDVYALGCVMYEMLAGEPPFAGSPTAILARQMLDPVPPLTTVRSVIPKPVCDVVYRALAKAPADRFQTAKEFAQALEGVANEPETFALAPPRRRRRWIPAAVAGAAVLALLGSRSAWSARERASEARAIAAADTTRLMVLPFERDTSVPAAWNADGLMRQALLRWNGVELVDPHAIAEASGGAALSASQAREVAIRLHAGRYLRGTITREGATIRIQAILFDVRRGTSPLFEATATARAGDLSPDASFAMLADRVLLRTSDPWALRETAAGTSSLAARQSYLRGRSSLEQWDLSAADSNFAAATRSDPRYASANLWLALTRVWSVSDSATWRYAAEAAAAGRAQLDPSDRARADALQRLAHGDRPRACAAWDAITQREPFSFSAWYGAADCLVQDKIVLKDPLSPTGWSFRSGYHSALRRYRRAFALQPAILRALRANDYAAVRSLLWTDASNLRGGHSGAQGAEYFAALPLWIGDTLAFVPIPSKVLAESDPQILHLIPPTVDLAVTRQRQLFREIAAGWVASDPKSAEAAHALSLALFLLGEPSAIDTLMRAKRLAVDPADRQRIVSTEVWVVAQSAIPDDIAGLRRARTLADSLLGGVSERAVDFETLASIAALTGHAFEADRLDRETASNGQRVSPSPAKQMSRSLVLFAAFGGPHDSLLALERRTDSVITAFEAAGERDAARMESLGRAVLLAFPEQVLASATSLRGSGPYLVTADAAFLRHDSARVRQILANVRSERVLFQLQPTIDGLYPEAWLLAATGDPRGAVDWLDPTLSRLRVSSFLVDPVNAAMLVRAMAFRADLATQLGDRRTAARWARAVVELWSGADDFLQPLVRRMRQLASDST